MEKADRGGEIIPRRSAASDTSPTSTMTQLPTRRPLVDGINLDDTLSMLLDFTKEGQPSRAAVAGRRRGTTATCSISPLLTTPLAPTATQQPPSDLQLPPPMAAASEGRSIYNGRRRNSRDTEWSGESTAFAGPLSAATLAELPRAVFTAQPTPRNVRDPRPMWLRTPDGAENQRR